jgi:hypothetical protein
MVLDEKDALLKKLDTLMNELEISKTNIKTLENTHDGLIFDGANTDASLAELTAATLQYQSLRRVIHNIEENMIPAADDKVENAHEEVIAEIRAAQQILYDRCAESILKKMSDILKLIQTFDLECKKIEEEAGITISQNLPVFYVQESDRVQYI